MTEQPPSAEARALAKTYGIFLDSTKLAAEIDALCEQRISAETERCAQIAAFRKTEAAREQRNNPSSSEMRTIWTWAADTASLIEKEIRAPAERSAPEGPQPKDDVERYLDRFEEALGYNQEPLGEEFQKALTATVAEQQQDYLRSTDDTGQPLGEAQTEITRLYKELAEVKEEAMRLTAQHQVLPGLINSQRLADNANVKAALLARLQEPDVREGAARALHEYHKPYCDYTYPFEHAMSGRRIYEELADAVIADITEKLR